MRVVSWCPVPCSRRLAARVVFACALAIPSSTPLLAQEPASPFEPSLNQPGKDVQWVPTPGALVEKMLDLAAVTPRDTVVDLGSGDGVIVIAAARRGARARGIEYDERLVAFSKRNAAAAGVASRTRFVQGDIFKSSFSDATVVTTFLLPWMNRQLRPTFLAMKPGTRIVANTFAIGDWEADDTASIEPCERWCTAMLWYVPARVGGQWRTPKGLLDLNQKYQFFTGTLDGRPIAEGRLRGLAISFVVDGVEYRGTVEDARMRVSATVDGKRVEWVASPLRR